MKNWMLLLTLAALWSCQGKEKEAEPAGTEKSVAENSKTVVPVKVMTLTPTSFIEEGRFFGDVKASTQAELISYTGGKVQRVYKKEGARVKKGERLCDIEGEKYQIAYETAQLEEKIAQQESARAEAHFKSGSFSQLQVDQAQTRLLRAKQATLEAKKNRDAAWCLSPMAGTLTLSHIEAHQTLPPGSPTVTVANLQEVEVEIGIPENEITGYTTQGDARVRVPARPDTLFPAAIHSIAQQVDARNRTFKVEVSLKNPGTFIKPGQTVEVILHKEKLENVIVVPNEILLNLEHGLGVMVVKDGTAHRVMVKKGGTGAISSHIIQGLAEGDQIITSGQALAVDGTPVKIIAD